MRNSVNGGVSSSIDRLILMALFERLGQRVITPGALCVLSDHAPRGFFGCGEIAQPPLRLREQVEGAAIVRLRREKLVQDVARLAGRFPAAGVHERGGISRLQLGVSRRPADGLLIGRRRLRPAVFSLVEIGERRQQPRIVSRLLLQPRNRVGVLTGSSIGLGEQQRAILPLRLLVHERGQQRNRFIELPPLHVKARERRPYVRIRLALGVRDRDLEVPDRLCDVVGRLRGVARLRLSAAAARRVALTALGERRVDDTEHPISFTIIGRDFHRLLRSGKRFRHFVLAQVQRRELRGDVGGARIELHRAFVRRDRLLDVVVLVVARE